MISSAVLFQPEKSFFLVQSGPTQPIHRCRAMRLQSPKPEAQEARRDALQPNSKRNLIGPNSDGLQPRSWKLCTFLSWVSCVTFSKDPTIPAHVRRFLRRILRICSVNFATLVHPLVKKIWHDEDSLTLQICRVALSVWKEMVSVWSTTPWILAGTVKLAMLWILPNPGWIRDRKSRPSHTNTDAKTRLKAVASCTKTWKDNVHQCSALCLWTPT